MFPGNTANPGAEFVELQLSAAGENQLFSTTSIQLYGPTGAVTGSGSFVGNPANGANQRFVLSSTAASADPVRRRARSDAACGRRL